MARFGAPGEHAKVYLIGIGMGDPDTMTIAARDAIESCDVLIGARRMLEAHADLPAEKLSMYKSEEIAAAVRERAEKRVGVLFSGDVGFFSGATRLRELLAAEGFEVVSVPGIATPVYFAARLGLPWEDMKLVSLHGREADIVGALREGKHVFALTGGQLKAQDVCARLADAGLSDVTVHVGERLSYADERIVTTTAGQAAHMEFADLAAIVVEQPDDVRGAEEPSERVAASQIAPRLLIAAPASGGGKTTFACGLLAALKKRGLHPAACKTGPDYIDPAFHRSALGVPSVNLDLFFSDEDESRQLVAENARGADITVIEGAMGFYDGIAVSDEASAWHVADATCTPVVLVVDARGRARSIAAEVKGYCSFREPSHVAAVVLNRVSAMLYPRLKELVEAETGVHVIGYVPTLEDEQLASRHLGLVMPDEVDELAGKLDSLAGVIERTVDIDSLLEIAASASPLRPRRAVLPAAVAGKPRIAVAHDEAFCFYYQATLDLLEKFGAELVDFSPLHDTRLPEGVSGLYLGGGYPELHARALNGNRSMLESIRHAIEEGKSTIAECGGFLYLHDTLEGSDGIEWPMAGVFPSRAYRTDKLSRFGYITMTAAKDGLLANAGEQLRAHEFHYWESSAPGDAFRARKPQSERSWDCSVMTDTLYAGFPHLYLPSNPNAAKRFVEACARLAF